MFKTFITTSLLLAFSFSLAEAATVSEITQFTFDLDGRTINIGTDNKDNFIAVYDEFSNAESIYVVFGTTSIAGTAWMTPVRLSAGDEPGGARSSDVAMDQTSTGLAIWVEGNGGTFTVETSSYSGGTWTPIAPPLDSSPSDDLISVSVAMNGTGKGVAGWMNNDSTEARASFFNAGVWSPFQVIGTGNRGMEVAYSPNGTAVASWVHFDLGISNLWANYFNGTSWIGPTLLDNPGFPLFIFPPGVGIDGSGNAFVIWSTDTVGTPISVSRFNGASWSAPVLLSTNGSDMVAPNIAVDLDGTAIAVFTDSSGAQFYSKFNGSTWGPPVFIAMGLNMSGTLNIKMDDQGDALIAWASPLNQLFTALLPKNGTLQPPVFIRQATDGFIGSDGIGSGVEPALSSLSTLGSIVWSEGFIEGGSDTFGVFIAFAPTPPTNLIGGTCKNGLDRVNIISWTPSTDPTTDSYRVFRNGVLIAIVPASGPFVFFDHNRCKGPTTYSLTAVNEEGIQSAPVTVTIR